MMQPYYKSDKKYSRSQIVVRCNNCKDSAFVLKHNGKLTRKCCRCGEDIG